MGLQLRVTVPDQPGALAKVARAIARAGADVISVSVLESDSGRAVDEFRLRWPDGKDDSSLREALAAEPGIELVGCRRTRWLLDGRADLDLLTYLLAVPTRGVETLVDMAPAALDADWAELRAPSRGLEMLYGSSSASGHDVVAPDGMPVRAVAGMTDDVAWAHLPLPPLHSVLVIGRDEGPGFLRSEISHAERVVSLALKTLGSVQLPESELANTSELTACLVEQRTRQSA
jgi:hypothetical protein